ncbi:MAG: polyprenyl synthetase family protein [Myxococcota bacterium]
MSERLGRLRRGFDRLLELVPRGVDLGSTRDVVQGDLVDDAALAELVGSAGFVGRSDIPRIRPILVAIAARATGASAVNQEAQHAAELLHLALRVHDLAIGREGGRRRRVARRLARSAGWMRGNQLTIRALELSRHTAPGVLEELLEALRAFGEAQALSRELVGVVPTEGDWLDHADAHTGALFAFCCRAGGNLSGAPAREMLALGRFGRHFGRLWHVAEDLSVLDHGQPALHLLARAAAGRPVLPVVYACEVDPRAAEHWVRLSTEGNPDDARELANLLRRSGVARSREVMVQESWRARRAIRVLPPSTYRTAMEKLAAQVARAGVRARSDDPAAGE